MQPPCRVLLVRTTGTTEGHIVKVTKAQAKALELLADGDELGHTDGANLWFTAQYNKPVAIVTLRALIAKGLIRPLVTCERRGKLRVVKVRVAA